jgi:ATP synthase protein I
MGLTGTRLIHRLPPPEGNDMQPGNDKLPSLEELQRKLDAVQPKGKDTDRPSGEQARFAKAMRLGTDLLAGAGVGCAIGYFADSALGTMPVFFILFFFIGFAAGVRNILRKTNEL